MVDLSGEKHPHESSGPYDGYNYLEFWIGRQYDDEADKMAVSRLLSQIKGSSRRLIDVGAGIGRLVPIYEERCEKFILLDSSARQLNQAKSIHPLSQKSSVLIGDGENIPLTSSSLDTALCVRSFHHFLSPIKVIQEINRILEVGGYLILEVPNQLHFKNRLGTLLRKIGRNLFSNTQLSGVNKSGDIVLAPPPQEIINLIKSNGFEILEILSVSNFRSRLLKKIFPTSLLIFLEELCQKFLARFWFGPSIYFLARKIS